MNIETNKSTTLKMEEVIKVNARLEDGKQVQLHVMEPDMFRFLDVSVIDGKLEDTHDDYEKSLVLFGYCEIDGKVYNTIEGVPITENMSRLIIDFLNRKV